MVRSPLMLDLLRAVYWFDEALQAGMRAAGLEGATRAQSFLLLNLASGEHRASRLAINLGVSRQAISQMLAEMEARGLITVTADPDDKRARIVNFSLEAMPIHKTATRLLLELETVLETRIGPDKLAGLRAGLGEDWGHPPQLVAGKSA